MAGNVGSLLGVSVAGVSLAGSVSGGECHAGSVMQGWLAVSVGSVSGWSVIGRKCEWRGVSCGECHAGVVGCVCWECHWPEV